MVKIVAKNKKDKKKAKIMNFILQKELKDTAFEEDVIKLSVDIAMFKIKYGVDIKYVLIDIKSI